jgi:UDP-2,4-diacetamido-2,4,6-trideoxy-beta-L-altropyranose hydrolase
MRVTIHSDSSPAIGAGHVARCLALAEALVAGGATVELAADELLDGQRARAGELGVQVVDRLSANREPDWAVIDGYHLQGKARASLARPGVPRLAIDDLGGPIPDAALVVNGNLYAAPGRPSMSTAAEQLLGPTYALLRSEYADAGPERSDPAVVERVLVTMGGADPSDATRLAIETLARHGERPAVRVVVGAAHAASSARAAEARSAGFEAVLAPPSLLPHLAWSDIVVGACGTTVLEVARLGRPLVGIIIADNQEPVAKAVESESLGIVAGRHPGLSVEQLQRAYALIARDAEWRSRIAHVGPQRVDGGGARRVVDALASGPLHLRRATMGDRDRLLSWRNDAATREASFDRQPVAAEEHERWLRARLDDPAHRILIGELSGVPVGVVRFATENHVATISIAVDAGRRRRGIGVRLIGAGVVQLTREGVADRVDAWIRSDNGASLAAFTAAGFRPVDHDASDRRLYRQPLKPMR